MPATFNAASYARGTAPDSFAVIFGVFSAAPTQVTLNSTINITPSLTSTSQVNFLIPNSIAASTIPTLTLYSGGNLIGAGTVAVNQYASALYSANSSGQGLVNGQLLRIINGQATYETLTVLGNTINPSTENDYFILYGTGLRGPLPGVITPPASLEFDGISVPVLYVGPTPGVPGLDQVNAGPLGANLKNRINKNLRLTVGGLVANIVTASLQ